MRTRSRGSVARCVPVQVRPRSDSYVRPRSSGRVALASQNTFIRLRCALRSCMCQDATFAVTCCALRPKTNQNARRVASHVTSLQKSEVHLMCLCACHQPQPSSNDKHATQCRQTLLFLSLHSCSPETSCTRPTSTWRTTTCYTVALTTGTALRRSAWTSPT